MLGNDEGGDWLEVAPPGSPKNQCQKATETPLGVILKFQRAHEKSMDRIDFYLDIVPLPLVILLAGFVVVLFMGIPARYRIVVALTLVPIWLTIGRLPALGVLSQAAKVSSSMSYLLVGLAALLHPGPRRQLPGITWLYLVMAGIAFLYVLRVEDRTLAIVLRLQWLTLVFASLMLIRTVVSAQDMMRVVNGLAFGCFCAIGLPLSGLILFPGEAFLRGAGRFQPYGVNSNQIGMLFALAIPLLCFKGLTTRAVSLKPFIFAAVGIALGMALLTGSRQTLLAILMVSIPIIFYFSKRPILTIIAIGLGFSAVSYVIGMADQTAFDRFSDLETYRFEVWSAYIRDVFAVRPLFGLFGVSGEAAFKSSVIGVHPHSAYMNLMYMGGLSLFVPMMILLFISLKSAFKVWRQRYNLGLHPMLTSILAMLLVAMYVQGLFNQVVYWPTYTWSFIHVILAAFFITTAATLQEEDPAWVLPDLDHDPWEMEFDEEEEMTEEVASEAH